MLKSFSTPTWISSISIWWHSGLLDMFLCRPPKAFIKNTQNSPLYSIICLMHKKYWQSSYISFRNIAKNMSVPSCANFQVHIFIINNFKDILAFQQNLEFNLFTTVLCINKFSTLDFIITNEINRKRKFFHLSDLRIVSEFV